MRPDEAAHHSRFVGGFLRSVYFGKSALSRIRHAPIWATQCHVAADLSHRAPSMVHDVGVNGTEVATTHSALREFAKVTSCAAFLYSDSKREQADAVFARETDALEH
jgi:hypothetical protein